MDNIVSQSANAKVAATTGLFKLIAERHRLHRGSVSAAATSGERSSKPGKQSSKYTISIEAVPLLSYVRD